MMNIDNYKGAVAWLRRSLAEFQTRSGDPMVQYALLQSFEVTHNLSEAILREAYVSLDIDEYAPYISLRELIWRAGEEGIVLCSRKDWLQYGLALETMREELDLTAGSDVGAVAQLISRFADELDSFARCLDKRLISNG
jgi:hypothetical protein